MLPVALFFRAKAIRQLYRQNASKLCHIASYEHQSFEKSTTATTVRKTRNAKNENTPKRKYL